MSEEIPRGLLCDYPTTSSEEEDDDTEEGPDPGISPRKRKSESLLGGVNNDFFFPRDLDGTFDLCGSQEQWKANLESKVRSFTPVSHSNTSLFEIDVTNWDIKVSHKRRRRSTQDEENTEKPSSESAGQHRRRKFTFKPFQKNDQGKLIHDASRPEVSVLVPEKLEASYGLYIWPCSHVLSWFIWAHEEDFKEKRILELGSGTSLPGLLCAKIGAASVTLTDRGSHPEVLKNIQTAVDINELRNVVQVKELTWGLLYQNLFSFEGTLDIILGSDLFFDPKVFKDLVLTVAKLLSLNPSSVFICAIQERSPDWSIAEYLEEFGLKATYIYPKDFLSRTGLDEGDLIGGHSIYIMKLFLN